METTGTMDPREYLHNLIAEKERHDLSPLHVQAIRYELALMASGEAKQPQDTMWRAPSWTAIALERVRAERERQDAKWGDQSGNHAFEWMSILGEEYGELCEAVNESCFSNPTHPERGGPKAILHEAMQVAAVAVAIMEAYLRVRDNRPNPACPPTGQANYESSCTGDPASPYQAATILKDGTVQKLTSEWPDAISTLREDMLRGYYWYGGKVVPTACVIHNILANQRVPRWILGECEFTEELDYGFENVDLYEALKSVSKSVGGLLVFDSRTFPWTVSLLRKRTLSSAEPAEKPTVQTQPERGACATVSAASTPYANQGVTSLWSGSLEANMTPTAEPGTEKKTGCPLHKLDLDLPAPPMVNGRCTGYGSGAADDEPPCDTCCECELCIENVEPNGEEQIEPGPEIGAAVSFDALREGVTVVAAAISAFIDHTIELLSLLSADGGERWVWEKKEAETQVPAPGDPTPENANPFNGTIAWLVAEARKQGMWPNETLVEFWERQEREAKTKFPTPATAPQDTGGGSASEEPKP